MGTKNNVVRRSKRMPVFASACEAIQVKQPFFNTSSLSNKADNLTWIASLRSQRRVAGFTLVELIVVITILIILGTIAFISLGGFSGSARDSSRVSDLTNLSKGLDIFYVKQGLYPSPDGAMAVTYSWATVWNQWTLGTTAVASIARGWAVISKNPPVDPLSNTAYVYSLASETREYSLKADYEGDSVAYASSRIPLLTSPILGEELSFFPPTLGGVGGGTFGLDSVSAATGNPTLTYIKGTYNGVVAKVTTGGMINLLAVPNILVSSGITSLTGSSVGFFVHGSSNSGGLLFVPRLVFSSGALPNSDTDRITFASGVVSAYSGTSLASNGNVTQFILAAGSTGALASVGGNFVNMKLGRSVSVSSGGGGTSNSCAANPSFSNLGALTVGSPTSVGQAWTYNVTPGNCTYVCTGGYSGNNCATAPIPAYVSASSTTAYTAGMQFAYSWVTVTVTSAGVGTGSSTYPGCDTPDIVLWASGYNPQIWSACNVGATTSVGFASVPTQSPNPSVDANTLPSNRVANVQGNYYQWGRSDNVTSGAWTTSQYGGSLSSTGSVGNTNFYQWDANGDWKWGWISNPAGGWNMANGGQNQYPCQSGYHIPSDDGTTSTEWPMAAQLIVGTASPSGAQYDTIRSTMKLPLAGYRSYSNGQYYNQGTYGAYWSASPTTAYSYYAYFSSGGGNLAGGNNRGVGFSVRCLRN